MAGIPERRDYDKEVHVLIQKLGRSESISKMATTLRMRNEFVSSSLGNLHQRGLLKKHEDETYPYYTPLEDSADGYLQHIERSIEFYHKEFVKNLKQFSKKKIFLNVKITKTETGGTATNYKINPKVEGLLRSCMVNLNYLQSLASKIRFLQILKIIPKTKSYNEKSERLENKIYTLIQSLIDRLMNEHHTQRDLLERHLKYELPVFNI